MDQSSSLDVLPFLIANIVFNFGSISSGVPWYLMIDGLLQYNIIIMNYIMIVAG